MSIFIPRANEINAINPKSAKKPNPMGNINLIGAPHNRVDFGGAIKFGAHMTKKAAVVFEKLSKKLTTEAREHISKKNFAEPKEKKYPIEDRAHARNALARVSQHGSPAEKAQVRAKVHAKYPDIGEEKKAEAAIPGQEAWEARHPEINDPKEQERNRSIRRKNTLKRALIPFYTGKTAEILLKLSKQMPHFEDQDRPEKAKEVFHALKEEHPEYSDGKKARIANAVAAGTVKH
jgi:hypothetical protein